MRPIDADALKDAMYTETMLKDTDMQRWDSGCWIRYKLFENVLREQPTIDAVPVRRGKWIDETFKPWGLVHHPYKCDQCGEHSEATSDFCPWCGAKMEANYETD